MQIEDIIKDQIQQHKIILYMKGTAEMPQCGFSAKAVSLLKKCNATFAAVNVLENADIREGIKAFSQWPTIPQLYVKGNFVGGCDIMTEMYEAGELQTLINED